MNKYSIAAEHGAASFTGIARLFLKQPGFAIRLFYRRLCYFFSRKFEGSLLTPDGFSISTPDALIAYWVMFVERELCDDRWVEAVRKAPQPLVVDVGANAGVFSHFIFCLNPAAEIVAFEPLPAMVAKLKVLKERTGINLTCHARAVSHSVGEVFFESPHGYDGISHISTSNQPAGNNFKVETTTLDTILGERKVTLIKIDVEGFECDVVAGGARVLANTQYVIAEAHTAEHLKKLTQALGSGWRCQKLCASDYLFYRA